MISYETAPGGMVIIKAPRIFKPQGIKSKKGDATYSATLPDNLFGPYKPWPTKKAPA